MKGGEEGDTGKQRTGGLGSFCSNLACKDRRSRKDRIGLQGSAIQCKNRRSIEIKDEKLRRKTAAAAAGILTCWPFCKICSFLPQNEPKLLQCYISWWAHAYLRKKYSSSNSVWPKKLGLLWSVPPPFTYVGLALLARLVIEVRWGVGVKAEKSQSDSTAAVKNSVKRAQIRQNWARRAFSGKCHN